MIVAILDPDFARLAIDRQHADPTTTIYVVFNNPCVQRPFQSQLMRKRTTSIAQGCESALRLDVYFVGNGIDYAMRS